MDEILIQKFKKILEEEKDIIKKELEKFAQKNKDVTGDWKTNFPDFGEETGGAALETAADEVEEYATLLPIERNLEMRLKNIKSALEKIKKGDAGKYGICENCGKEISRERLDIFPEARTCKACK